MLTIFFIVVALGVACAIFIYVDDRKHPAHERTNPPEFVLFLAAFITGGMVICGSLQSLWEPCVEKNYLRQGYEKVEGYIIADNGIVQAVDGEFYVKDGIYYTAYKDTTRRLWNPFYSFELKEAELLNESLYRNNSVCSQCGTSGYTPYCENCGTPIMTAQTCHGCGTAGFGSYCGRCGTKFPED